VRALALVLALVLERWGGFWFDRFYYGNGRNIFKTGLSYRFRLWCWHLGFTPAFNSIIGVKMIASVVLHRFTAHAKAVTIPINNAITNGTDFNPANKWWFALFTVLVQTRVDAHQLQRR
jgi:hypothetical protein